MTYQIKRLVSESVPFHGAGSAPQPSAKTDLRTAPTLFTNEEVQAALAWKYGRFAQFVFVESIWPLIDEYRAFKARESIVSPVDPRFNQHATRLQGEPLPCPTSGCSYVRRFEGGGRVFRLGPREECEHCGCPIVKPADDRAAMKIMIDRHLL